MGDASPLTCEMARWPIACSPSENRRSRLKVDSVIALSHPIRNPPPNMESGRRIVNAPKPFRMSVCKNANKPSKEAMSVAMSFKHKQGWILSVIGKSASWLSAGRGWLDLG